MQWDGLIPCTWHSKSFDCTHYSCHVYLSLVELIQHFLVTWHVFVEFWSAHAMNPSIQILVFNRHFKLMGREEKCDVWLSYSGHWNECKGGLPHCILLSSILDVGFLLSWLVWWVNSGFTRTNYKELGELYSKYKESGKMAVCELMFHPGFPYQGMSVKGQRLGHYMQAQNWYRECWQ